MWMVNATITFLDDFFDNKTKVTYIFMGGLFCTTTKISSE